MAVIINGTTGIDTVQDGVVTDAKLTLTANSQEIKDALNATGSAPIYACRAWVVFDGTGTPSIKASGNVSSITDGGTGIFTINFTTAMPDINYAVGNVSNSTNATVQNGANIATYVLADKLVGSLKVYISDASSQTLFDTTDNTFTFHR